VNYYLRLDQLRSNYKKIYAQVPIRVEYSITKQTSELGKILKQLDIWVIQWRKEKPKKK
jgi:DNA-binding HxlR family transcriptional regulator